MEIEDRLGTEGLYSYCMLQSLYIGVLAPLCISMWGPVVSVVYTAIYTKSDQWDVDMSSLVITSSSESLYYLGLPRIMNFLFSILSWYSHYPFLRMISSTRLYTMCMESGPVRLRRRLAEVSQTGAGPTQDHPRMISSPIFYNLAYFFEKIYV